MSNVALALFMMTVFGVTTAFIHENQQSEICNLQ